MKALGTDGLDEVGQMQLNALRVEDDDDEEEEEDSGGEEESEVDEESEVKGSSEIESEPETPSKVLERVREEEGEEEEFALEDAESVDEDAVPRQKIVTNDKVRISFRRRLLVAQSFNQLVHPDCYREDTRHHQARPLIILDGDTHRDLP